LIRSVPHTSGCRQLCFNVSGFIARNAHVCGDPTDLDGNLVGRGRLLMMYLFRSKGPNVVINLLEHVLARRSLGILHRLDGGLAVGENDHFCWASWWPLVPWLVDEFGNRHFNAVELGNVHC
jgi:hypothetical protein